MMKKIVRSSWLALVLLFMYLPVVILAVYSFTDTATIGTSGHFSLQNYKTLFTTGELLSMIGGTFALAFGSALIATILGTIGAIGAFYSKKGSRRFMDFANQIPVVNAEVVTGFSIPGIVSGFMLSVTLSLDDYFITTYTKPSTFDTISTYVVNATKGSHTEIKTALWALSTLIFVVIVAGVLAWNLLADRKAGAENER